MSIITSLLNFKWVILFYVGVVSLVYLNRNKFEKQASFVYLLKTKIGLSLMDKIGRKHEKIVKIWGYFGIVIAYIGFVFITVILVKNAYDLLINKPGTVGGSPVIPGLPIAGMGITFPLFIGWISLFIIMIVHEFSHGYVARAHNVKVKSSGIAFFGPIMGAFVEPDEKEIRKAPHRVQNSIFAAGPVSNAVLWIVCTLLIIFVMSPIIISQGEFTGIKTDPIVNASLPAYAAGLPKDSVIVGINDYEVTNFSTFVVALDSLSPNEKAVLKTKEKGDFEIITSNHPDNESKAYVGITNFEQDFSPKRDNFFGKIVLAFLRWFNELLIWTGFISINIGLINLFPIFITDGAQMLRTNFHDLFKNDRKKADLWWKHVNTVAVVILLVLLFMKPLRSMFDFVFGLLF